MHYFLFPILPDRDRTLDKGKAIALGSCSGNQPHMRISKNIPIPSEREESIISLAKIPKLGGVLVPPNPDMGIKNDHSFDLSHSSAGSPDSSGVPAEGKRFCASQSRLALGLSFCIFILDPAIALEGQLYLSRTRQAFFSNTFYFLDNPDDRGR